MEKLRKVIQEHTGDVFPGLVALVSQKGRVVFCEASGYRSVFPEREEMSVDTIFDLASLTKVIATAPSILELVEGGELTLEDNLGYFFPELKNNWKGEVRILDLLTHSSGFPPYLQPAQETREAYIDKLFRIQKAYERGKQVVYSCINYIFLGFIVEKITGENLNEFTRKHIFEPLGMTDSFFMPPASQRNRIASTEKIEDHILKGIVHDPAARKLGGISGNAGLFSTAEDIHKFALMILNSGVFGNKQILRPETVKMMARRWIGDRALGFAIKTETSKHFGSYFDEKSLCHTGYTGTSLLIDLKNEIIVILLANRVHPEDKNKEEFSRFRRIVHNIVAMELL
ncbi:MAG TPA: penicillin-binding protein [candidate division WOR-3 bacterium]|uniref:Penicillin-binding protein n=1 Tax=candidate division WOR-3 bacterium TaxID=2052148 RepID=A0A7V5LTF3_UNCW3|nr:penicillin-binding protein [candidate division WOR-3 bacterium]